MSAIQKFIANFLLATFVLVALWGVSFGMDHEMAGISSPCPIMADYDVACAMGIGEHLTIWKQAFSATFQAGLIMIAFVGFWMFSRRDLQKFYDYLLIRSSWMPPTLERQRRHNALLSNPILQARSAGILEPKIH